MRDGNRLEFRVIAQLGDKMVFSLFFMFAKIGLFTFGGGYAMISIIEHICVEQKKWITHDEMMDVTVIAESTPGPIMVNLATYVGSSQVGILGGLKPCIAGIILAMGCHMILKNCVTTLSQTFVDLWPVIMTMILATVYFGSRKVSKKKMSPFTLILVSAVLGVAAYTFVPGLMTL